MKLLSANLRTLWRRGLWPFTPDPAPPGLHTFGTPAAGAPLLITGNSRATLGRLRRWLTPMGARILAVDTGGVDVCSALAAGALTIGKVEAALQALDQGEEASRSPADASEAGKPPRQALLPYLAWEAFGGDGLDGRLAGWQIAPGPADARDLPGFLGRGGELTEAMKRLRFPLEDRLPLMLAHVGLFVIVAALPLLAFGPLVLAAGAGLALGSALLLAVAWPLRPGTHERQGRILLLLGLTLVAAGLGALLNLSPLTHITWSVAVLCISGWIAVASSRRP